MSLDNSTLPPGTIIPPDDIKSLVDNTANIVAKDSILEEVVKQKFQDNPSFSFLSYNDPYRQYFDWKVSQEIKRLKREENGEDELDEIQNQKQQKENENRLDAPPPDKYTFNPGKMGAREADIIKLTAQFVASNGQKFLIALTEKEKKNPSFEFLKPSHPNFPYFSFLIDSYARIISFSRAEEEEILKTFADKQNTLARCLKTYEYEHQLRATKRKREEIEEAERQQMAMVDWNDFIVVQTITFDEEDEELPEPLDLTKRDYIPQLRLNKANINPEFAFLIDQMEDPSDPKDKKLNMRKENQARAMKDYKDIEENPPDFPSDLTKRNIESSMIDPNQEIAVEIVVPYDYTDFGSYEGKEIEFLTKLSMKCSEFLEKVEYKIGTNIRKYTFYTSNGIALVPENTMDELGIQPGESITLTKT